MVPSPSKQTRSSRRVVWARRHVNEGCQTLGIIFCAHKILSRRPDTVYPLLLWVPQDHHEVYTPLGCASSGPHSMADLTSLLCCSKPGPYLFSQTSLCMSPVSWVFALASPPTFLSQLFPNLGLLGLCGHFNHPVRSPGLIWPHSFDLSTDYSWHPWPPHSLPTNLRLALYWSTDGLLPEEEREIGRGISTLGLEAQMRWCTAATPGKEGWGKATIRANQSFRMDTKESTHNI